jgi:predicted anti-sigma-YlaC factor YlaD
MTLTCEQIRDFLGDFLDGDLDPELHREIEQHLKLCPHCFVAIRQYQATILVTRALGRSVCEPLPAVFETRLRAMLAVYVQRRSPDDRQSSSSNPAVPG